MLQSINPANGLPLRTYPEQPPLEVKSRFDHAARAFEGWRRQDFATRAALLLGVAQRLRGGRDGFAWQIAEEMGKPIAQGLAEVDKCAWVCEYFAENGAKFLAAEPVVTDFTRSQVIYQPLGPVLAIMPWNFPFWQVFRCVAPALIAGNTVVLKHASNVTGCALAIGTLFREAGAPVGVFQTVMLGSARIAEAVRHPLVRGVALTGSTAAGRAVAALAGQQLVKTVLELGGSDPYLILEDADLQTAVEACVQSRLINAGQSCIAAKRFIVIEHLRELFEQMVAERMAREFVGDPQDERTTVGPLARTDLREALHKQVKDSVRLGARCILGGEKLARPGWFYPPTVLSGVKPGMPAFDEETFGPVAAVIGASDEAEAVRLANLTPFGLGAAVFTPDVQRGERVALDLSAGCCFINDFVRSDPRLPFGGIKDSGYGRELGLLGIREFMNAKTLVVR